ncbi:hypothetical protein F2Q68_00014273 [Brassica cretica]|uniref:Uncharacterized protein n=1 Tax=Brassica cretica TaxID=69181 RepID=A0A8S9HS17_BRACR|nr:hypothetical protein F2Q68_00014273 [Brassica cretica]
MYKEEHKVSFVRSPKSGLASLPPADWSFPNPSVRYLRDGTGAEPYNLCFHQPVPHLLFLSWPICFGWDSQGHALPSYGVDNVWSRFHWVLMAGPRLGLPCFACPGIMSVPRSTEAKCLILISSIAKLWQLALISFLDARI